jgi:hypothetical protein
MLKTHRSNFRVVIRIDDPIQGTKEYAANQVVAQVKRHVDYNGRIDIEWDTLCDFCGADPEPIEYSYKVNEIGMPQCCDKAQAFWQQSKEVPR